MPTLHFFTNPDSLQPQTAQQKYGPVAGSETSQYRVTSLFSSSTVQDAYAVCNGKVFAQEVNGRINLVLKPTQQPTGICAPVKYYIYKNLMKDSLVDSNDAKLIASSTKSDLTTKIQKSQKQRNEALGKLMHSSTPTDLPKINSVGLHLTATAPSPDTLLDATLIDDVFLRMDDDEFPTVAGGDKIGQFEYLNFGFEIILDGLGEGPTLQALRNLATVIVVSPASSGEVARFKEDDAREQILDYIDPCAFYAAFFFDGVKVKHETSDVGFSSLSKKPLYDGVLARFGTLDTIYLDLRNEHNHSLNYYRNYNEFANPYASFYLGFDGGSSAIQEYHDHGWPIFTIRTNAFTSTDAKRPSTLSLNLPQGDNASPMILRTQGYFYNGFRRMDQVPDLSETLRPYVPLQADSFTAPVAFSVPKLADNTTIPSYINLRYLKQVGATTAQTPPAGSRALPAEHFVDNLFELTQLLGTTGLKIPLDTDDITRWHVTGGTAVVDASSHYGPAYPAKIGIGQDQHIAVFHATAPAAGLVTGSTSKTGLLPVLAKAQRMNGEFGYVEILDPDNVKQPVLIHNGLDDGILDTAADLSPLAADDRSMIVLAIHNDELPSLQSTVALLEPALDKRLALRNKKGYTDGHGNVIATEYDLFVIGYQLGTGVSVVALNTQIKLRNLSRKPRVFSSRDAAATADLLDPVTRNRKNFSQSRIAKGTILRLRSTPRLPKSNEPGNLYCETQGAAHRITVLGKQLVINDNKSTEPEKTELIDRIWYYVELLEAIAIQNSALSTPVVLPAGLRCWIGGDLGIVSAFENFITDLIELNDVVDSQQPINPEPLVPRITRLRQRTKEAGDISTLFDLIIGALPLAAPPAVRLHDPGNYVSGSTVTLDTYELATKIQLFEDYMEVALGNGRIIDLHHFFIGMDVLNYEIPNAIVDPASVDWKGFFFPDQSLGNNVDATTWAGDIGAIPADDLFIPTEAPGEKGIDWRYQAAWRSSHQNATLEQEEAAFLEHYWETRAKDEDLLADVYCHLARHRLLDYVSADPNPVHRNLAASIYYFNRELATDGDRHAFQIFVKRLGLDPFKPLPYTFYPTVWNHVKTAIYDFSVLWYYNRFHSLVGRDNDTLSSMADSLADRFLTWLERHR